MSTSIFFNVLQRSGFTAEERMMREALQNSVDAHRLDADSPVSVRIRRDTLIEDQKRKLVEALGLDREVYARRKLFGLETGNALDHIKDPKSPLSNLVISDYHTCGLGGRWNEIGEEDHFGRLVVNLGVEGKPEEMDISGGSFGFGKTVYAKASRVGIVAYYSVFRPTDRTENVHARFMTTGLFKSHEYKKVPYNGFAFFGDMGNEDTTEVMPITNEDAHDIAEICGIGRREKDDYGTSILIVDCDLDLQDLKTAAEKFWWPRLMRNELDLIMSEGDHEIFPRPKKNPSLRPFIECNQNLISETQSHPKSKIYDSFRRITVNEGLKNPGRLSCVLLDEETELTNTVALIRGPGMVVRYHPAGSQSYEPCVGIFSAHTDVEKILTYSEPQMHDQWDLNSERLEKKFGADGPKAVNGVMNRIENTFRDFQLLQEPPIPPGGIRPKALSSLLGRFLSIRGSIEPPPEQSLYRPISIHVHEDRKELEGEIWDEADISISLRKTDDESTEDLDPIEATVTAFHELLGDSSHRIVERTDCILVNSASEVVASGNPATTDITIRKEAPVKLTARARSSEMVLSRIRIILEKAVS